MEINTLETLIATLRHLEAQELSMIDGWDATPRLTSIREALDHLIEAQDILRDLPRIQPRPRYPQNT